MAKIFEMINKSGYQAVQRAKNTNEIARINALIQSEEHETEQKFAQIGHKYYALAVEKNDDGGELFAELFNAVSQSQEKITAYQAEILKVKNVKRCPSCGRECSKDSLFCSGCGKQLPVQSVALVDILHCANCGTEVAHDDLFCFNCGNKIER